MQNIHPAAYTGVMGRPAKVDLPTTLTPDERKRRLRNARLARHYEKNRDRLLEERQADRENDPEKHRAYGRNSYRKHRSDRLAKNAEYARLNPEAKLEARLKHSYGIGVAEYNALLEAQGGSCAICEKVNKDGKRLVVDHCHETGVIRGLLCSLCNLALGHMKDDPKRLRTAADYLEREG